MWKWKGSTNNVITFQHPGLLMLVNSMKQFEDRKQNLALSYSVYNGEWISHFRHHGHYWISHFHYINKLKYGGKIVLLKRCTHVNYYSMNNVCNNNNKVHVIVMIYKFILFRNTVNKILFVGHHFLMILFCWTKNSPV